MIKVGLISLGCAKNLVDSEMILGMLSKSKFEIVNSIEDSDIIIVNTCGFIEASKKESIDNILDVVKYDKKVVVVGCLVERYKKELQESIPEVDLFVSIKEYATLNEQLEKLIGSQAKIEKLNPFTRLLCTPKYMAYLRISEGCNNCCTFCAIPLIRGSFRSRPFEDLIKEAKDLASKGIKELVVISQDTTKYGIDLKDGNSIVTLLKTLEEIEGFTSIRLLYLYPDEITDELLEFIKHSKKVAQYFDIPFQHSSNRVLKNMHRRGTKESYLSLIKKIREYMPNAILRTTNIVGFPGETEEDFEDLVEFTKEIKFDHMGAFKYSREDGTVAYNLPDQIEESVKSKRLARLLEVQKKISYEQNKLHIGEVMHGIVVGYNHKTKQYNLRSYWNAPDDIDGYILFTSNKELNQGDEVNVKITNAYVYDLFGEVVE